MIGCSAQCSYTLLVNLVSRRGGITRERHTTLFLRNVRWRAIYEECINMLSHEITWGFSNISALQGCWYSHIVTPPSDHHERSAIGDIWAKGPRKRKHCNVIQANPVDILLVKRVTLKMSFRRITFFSSSCSHVYKLASLERVGQFFQWVLWPISSGRCNHERC